MSYHRKILQPGEAVLHEGGLHWNVFATGASVLVLAALVALMPAFVTLPADLGAAVEWIALVVLVIGLLSLAGAALRRASTEIVVTDRRILFKRGLLSRFTVEMNMSKVETVDVEQGVLGRLLDYGTVLIRGTGSTFEPLRDVRQPLSLRQAILAR